MKCTAMFLNGVREKVQDGIEYNIANGVCGEALGNLRIGWTLDTYLSFWKPFYDEKYIYQLNYGHFV